MIDLRAILSPAWLLVPGCHISPVGRQNRMGLHRSEPQPQCLPAEVSVRATCRTGQVLEEENGTPETEWDSRGRQY
jgi:hypothetical protein